MEECVVCENIRLLLFALLYVFPVLKAYPGSQGVQRLVLVSVGLPISEGTWQEGPGQTFSTARREREGEPPGGQRLHGGTRERLFLLSLLVSQQRRADRWLPGPSASRVF